MEGIKFGARCSVGVKVAVGPSKVLAVVDGEVEMVEGVVGGAVDVFLEPMARYHVAVMDEDCPDLYQDEHGHIEVLLHGADKNEDTEGKLLEMTIESG